MDTTPLAAQLIGEGPRFDAVPTNAVLLRIQDDLYARTPVTSNVF